MLLYCWMGQWENGRKTVYQSEKKTEMHIQLWSWILCLSQGFIGSKANPQINRFTPEKHVFACYGEPKKLSLKRQTI